MLGFRYTGQTFDTRLLSQYDASVLRELYPVCRHTTVSAEQQVRLAERIRQENLRFAELIRCDGGVLAPASETELERMRDNALREILTEEQLLQYYLVTKRFRQPTPAGAKPRRSFRSSSNSPIWS